MDSQQRTPLSQEVVSEISDEKIYGKSFEEAITDIAYNLWVNSITYKQPRMNRISMYERLYNNELPPKQRQLFNICMPIFAGFEDAMQANLNDPVQIEFQSHNPANMLVLPKIQSQWEMERDGLGSHQMWNSKARDMMHDALLSGRAIGKIFAENDPSFRNVFDEVNYATFHCQPLGGGDLENHLFAGEDSVFMTIDDIISNEEFPAEQRKKIRDYDYSSDWWQNLPEDQQALYARFRSIGLDVKSNTFTGTKTLALCQFVVTRNGQRYYVLFDPLSKIWLQVEKAEDKFGFTEYPWKSAATHQDSQNFWSKGFSDDMFQVALTISTMINQELTNREKMNFNARAYDPTIFTDEAKLDAAQYIPDRLVPVDTMNGTRKIADGIYSFETAQLQGTINLVQWLESDLGKNVGITDLTMGAGGKGNAKASVQLAQQQQVAKRIGFRAEGFKEMFGRFGQAYVANLKNFMPASLPVKLIGESGFTEEAELKRSEVVKMGEVNITVVSTSAQQQDNDSKTEMKKQALTMVAQDPNVSSEWRTEQTLRFGGWEDQDIKMAMDTQTYGSRKMVAKASEAIQELLKGKMPEPYFNADTAFMQYIQDFMVDNKPKLMKEVAHPTAGVAVPTFALFGEYLQEVTPLAQENMKRKAAAVAAGRMPTATATGLGNGQTEPGGAPKGGVAVAAPTNA